MKYLLIAFTLCSHSLTAQTVQKTLVDRWNNPISFAKVICSKHKVGTLSEENGAFVFNLNINMSPTDSIEIRHVGFETIYFQIKEFIKIDTIRMRQANTNLHKVEVKGIQSKKLSLLGNISGYAGVILLDTLGSGSSYALKINNKDLNAKEAGAYYLKKINIDVASAHHTMVRLGIRICEIDTITNLPGKDLLPQQIIKEFKVHKPFYPSSVELSFDISNFGFVLDRPVYVIFEHLQLEREKEATRTFLKNYQEEHPGLVKQKETITKTDTIEYVSYRFLGLDKKRPYVAIAGCISGKCLEKNQPLMKEVSYENWELSPFAPAVTIHAVEIK